MYSALFVTETIDQAGRYHIGTSKQEVGNITNTGSHGPLSHKMYENLHKLDQDTCYRSHSEGSYHNRYLGKIKLIKRRCKKRDRKLKIHQYSCHSTKHGYLRDGSCSASFHGIPSL